MVFTSMFKKRAKIATKLRVSCHRCKTVCAPADGDWKDGETNQVFVCHPCDNSSKRSGSPSFYKPPRSVLTAVTA